MDNIHIFQPPNKENHKPIQKHKLKNSFQNTNTLQQLIKPRPDNITPEHKKSGTYKLAYNTCHMTYIGQMRHNLKQRYQEHIRYIKNSDPQPAYALHILNNRHEYRHTHDT
jgi:hypothetical protein